MSEYVEQELESNPLLEADDGQDGSAVGESAGNGDDRNDVGLSVIDAVDGQDEAPLDVEAAVADNESRAGRATTVSGTFGHRTAPRTWGSAAGCGDDRAGPRRHVLAETPDLHSHLVQQLPDLAIADPADDRSVGMYPDRSSWTRAVMCATPISPRPPQQLGVDLVRLEGVLGGAAALRSGRHLRPQSQGMPQAAIGRPRPLRSGDGGVHRLRIELLAARDLRELRDICGVSGEDLQDMIAEVRALDPKPALRLERAINGAVIPDVIMTPQPDGGWRVELNSETLPRVLVNRSYIADIGRLSQRGESTRPIRQFLAERLQSANWLVKALHQRAETILKVATELVKQQDAFFRLGVTHLRPLILRDVADAIEMHESTVSRVTTNKYMATPRGVFELKYFFTQALAVFDQWRGNSLRRSRAAPH